MSEAAADGALGAAESDASLASDSTGSSVEGTEHAEFRRSPRRQQLLRLSLTELALARHNPQRLSAEYVMCFYKVRREFGSEGIDRRRVIECMRIWQHLSILVGGDVTWGMADKVGRSMGISAVDVEGAAAVALGPTRSRRKGRAQEELAILVRLVDEVRTMPDYKILARTQDESVPTFLGLLAGKRLVQVTNAAFDRLVEGAGRIMSSAFVHRTTCILLLAQLVAPDDRSTFFEGFMQALFVPSRCFKSTFLLKWFQGDGEIRLCIVSFRPVKVGHLSGVQILFEAAPQSKRLTSRPHRNQVIDTFRRHDTPSPGPSPSAASSSSSISLHSESGARPRPKPRVPSEPGLENRRFGCSPDAWWQLSVPGDPASMPNTSAARRSLEIEREGGEGRAGRGSFCIPALACLPEPCPPRSEAAVRPEGGTKVGKGDETLLPRPLGRGVSVLIPTKEGGGQAEGKGGQARASEGFTEGRMKEGRHDSSAMSTSSTTSLGDVCDGGAEASAGFLGVPDPLADEAEDNLLDAALASAIGPTPTPELLNEVFD